MHIKTLMQAVQCAAFAKKTGARLTQDASGDVYVHDCPVWNKDNAMLLRLLKPNAHITVQSSAASMSGFVIVVHEPPVLAAKTRVWVLCIAAAVFTLLVAATHVLLSAHVE